MATRMCSCIVTCGDWPEKPEEGQDNGRERMVEKKKRMEKNGGQ